MLSTKKIVLLSISGVLAISALTIGISTAISASNNKEFSYLEQKIGSQALKQVDESDFYALIGNAPKVSEYLLSDHVVDTPYAYTIYGERQSEKRNLFETQYYLYPSSAYIHHISYGGHTLSDKANYELMGFEFIVSKDETLFRIDRFYGYKNESDLSDPANKFNYNLDQVLINNQKKWIKLDVKEVEEPKDSSIESMTTYYTQMAAKKAFDFVNDFSNNQNNGTYLVNKAIAFKDNHSSNYTIKNHQEGFILETQNNIKCSYVVDNKVSLLITTYDSETREYTDHKIYEYALSGDNQKSRGIVYTETGKFIDSPDIKDGMYGFNYKDDTLHIHDNGAWVKIDGVTLTGLFRDPLMQYVYKLDTFEQSSYYELLGEQYDFNSYFYFSYQMKGDIHLTQNIHIEAKHFKEQMKRVDDLERAEQDSSSLYVSFNAFGDISYSKPSAELNISELYKDAARQYAEATIKGGN